MQSASWPQQPFQFKEQPRQNAEKGFTSSDVKLVLLLDGSRADITSTPMERGPGSPSQPSAASAERHGVLPLHRASRYLRAQAKPACT